MAEQECRKVVMMAMPFKALTDEQSAEVRKLAELLEVTEGEGSALCSALRVLRANQMWIDGMYGK
ncbi:MAG: hypothetical protein K6E22_12735 [Treponema sp.]|nr:hypothetical protein [Treponema sp.]